MELFSDCLVQVSSTTPCHLDEAFLSLLVINKKDLPKNVKVSIPRIRTLIKDKEGFEYKSTRSKNSEVKKYFREPIKKDTALNYSEDEYFVRVVNDKYSISFNKKMNKAEISQVIPPSLFKGYTAGRTAHLKTISLTLEDVRALKEDESLLEVLVEV